MSVGTPSSFPIRGTSVLHGFEALATTSMGYAFSAGQRDNTIDRDRIIEHVSAIASATNLAVSADLENGFGDAPEIVAETIKLAAAAGVVGGSIEDATGVPAHPIYELGHAAEKMRAAAATARAPLCFRPDGTRGKLLAGRPDLGDTIERLQAH
jgi:2-methylisocitrate lyase-like PEP mutase family enzyme